MFASLPTSNVPEILLLRVSTFTSSYSLTTTKTGMHASDRRHQQPRKSNQSITHKELNHWKKVSFFFSIFFFGNCYLNQFTFVSWYVRYRYASLLRFWLAANSGGISDALMSVKEAKKSKKQEAKKAKKQKSKKQEAKSKKAKNKKAKNRKTENRKTENRKQKTQKQKTENTKQKTPKNNRLAMLHLSLSVSLSLFILLPFMQSQRQWRGRGTNMCVGYCPSCSGRGLRPCWWQC